MQGYKMNVVIIRLALPAIFMLIVLAINIMTHGTLNINVGGICICFLGLDFTYIGILFGNAWYKHTHEYTGSCEGYVSGHTKFKKLEDNRHYYSAIYSYTVDGEEYSSKSRFSKTSESQIPTIGSKVIIHYHPNDPKLMQSDNDLNSNKKFACLFLAAGIPLMVIGAALLQFV